MTKTETELLFLFILFFNVSKYLLMWIFANIFKDQKIQSYESRINHRMTND